MRLWFKYYEKFGDDMLKAVLIIILTFSLNSFAEENNNSGTSDNFLQSLSAEEQEILNAGEMDTFSYIGGGLIGTYIGLGLGHSVQGRYWEKGWIFTAGEIAGLFLILNGATSCFADITAGRDCDGSSAKLGGYMFYGFRIWEIVDLWLTPYNQNQKYRALNARRQSMSFQILPIVERNTSGLALSMSF